MFNTKKMEHSFLLLLVLGLLLLLLLRNLLVLRLSLILVFIDRACATSMKATKRTITLGKKF